MVPSSRLLAWTALVALPLCFMAGFDRSGPAPWAQGIGCLVLLFLIDLAVSFGRLDGLTVESPAIQRLIQDREGDLEFFIQDPSKKLRHLKMGWSFPRSLESAFPEMEVDLPPGSARSRLTWPMTARERGRILLDKSYLETPSWLGFWDMRRAVPAQVEIRVYPNLASERKGLAALFLNRGGFGIHARRQVGKGRDFDKLREYVHGDSYGDIDWKATARRSHPITKTFRIERTQEVYVIVDASRLSARIPEGEEGRNGGRPRTVLERFINASMVLRVAAEKQGDLFGLMTFSDKVHGFLPAKNGQGHYNACRNMLYDLMPRKVTPDFDELFTTIRLKIRRRALLFFLTSLDDPLLAENFAKSADLLSAQHLVVVGMIRPKEARPLFEAGDETEAIDLHARLGGHMLWSRLKELEKELKSRGVTFSLLRNEDLSAELVSRYIDLKQRQLL